MKKVISVNEYFSVQPKKIQADLKRIREIILTVVPKAEEGFSYGMPSYKYFGPIAYFAVFKNHIGFFPTPSAVSKFKKEFSKYEFSKGGVKFPFGKPLPLLLIKKIVRFKLKENLNKLK